jgi:bacillithiol biosynthesis deacetylase BshB1
MTTSTIGLDPKLDVLAFGAHPDDVELGCGGTLALLAEAGRQVGIVHLTRGEAGTRGTEETRRAEAVAAAEVLGAQILEIVDCGDGHLRHGDAEEDLVIEILRRYRPDLVLAPTPADRHPDHGRAHRLVSDSCFYAGLAGRGLAGEVGELAPHRPAAMLAYMQHDPFDVSPSHRVKARSTLQNVGYLAAKRDHAGHLIEKDLKY